MAPEKMAREAVGIVIALVVAALMVAYVLPIAIDALLETDTSGWGEAETQLYELIPLFVVLVPFVVIVGWAMDAF